MTAPPPVFGLVKWVNYFWVACNSLEMVILNSKGIIRSGFTWVRRVASRWSGLKTNGDSVQLPVPATLSITGQHMGADNGCTSHAKVCLCQSKPQHMGRTLKHSSQGGFNPQNATHRDNYNCPFLYNVELKRDRDYLRNVALSMIWYTPDQSLDKCRRNS